MSDSKLLLTDGRITEFSTFIKQRIRQSRSYKLITYRASLETLKKLGLLSKSSQGQIIIVSPSGMKNNEVESLIRQTKSNPKIEVRQWDSQNLQQIMHQKTLILELEDGTFESYIGSANFTTHGTPFGTDDDNKFNNELSTQVIHTKDHLSELFLNVWNQSSEVDSLDFDAKCLGEMEELNSRTQLVEFQKMMVRRIYKIYKAKPSKGVHGCVLNMPTGTGKTITSIFFLLRYVIQNADSKVLWIAPSRELIDQAQNQFEKMSNQSDLALEDLYDTIEFKTIHKVQTILNSNTTESDEFRDSLRKYNAVVIDEAHFGSDLNNKMLPNILNDFPGFRLGLSATPFRMDVMGSIMFKKFFSNQRAELTEEDLKGKPELSIIDGKSIFPKINPIPIAINGLQLEPTQFGIDDLQGKNAKFKDGSHIKKAVLTQIAEFYSKKEYGITLIFCKDTDHANALYDSFTKNHVTLRIEVLHTGYIPQHGRSYTSQERKTIYDDTRKGEIDVLIVVDLYTTGIDFPNIESIFILRPTNSPLLYTQMIGRGMRGPAFGGTEKLNIVDFIQDGDTHEQSSSRLMNYANHNQEIAEVAATSERITQIVNDKNPFKVQVNTVLELVNGENPNQGIFKVVTPNGQNIRIDWKHSGSKSLSDWLYEYRKRTHTFFNDGNKETKKGVLKNDWKVIHFLIKDNLDSSQLQKITNEIRTLVKYNEL